MVQRGTASTEAKHWEMPGVRRLGEAAGAHEEGPHEVGGGRLPDLPAASAPAALGSSETWHGRLCILPGAYAGN